MDEGETKRLADTLEVAALPVRFSAAIDNGDWAGLAGVLTPNAVFEADGEQFEGAGVISAMVQAGLTGLDHSQHFITNVVVQLDGDRASLTSYLQAQHVRTDTPGGMTFLVGGVFRDTAARTAEDWRFTTRSLTVLWTEGNPAVHA